MEVILNSDIAKYVLGYLIKHNYEDASLVFSKSSPFLQEEYELLKQGYKPINLSSEDLVDIIKEYCAIRSIVSRCIEQLPKYLVNKLCFQVSTRQKLEFLIKIIQEMYPSYNLTAGRKRRRSINSVSKNTSDVETECPQNNNKEYQSFIFLNSDSNLDDPPAKRVCKIRTPSPSYFLNDKNELVRESLKSVDIPGPSQVKPTNVSIPDFPVFSETILDNTDFQNKLVENINKMLQTNQNLSCNDDNNSVITKNLDSTLNTSIDTPDKGFQNLLDEAIKSIVTATEQDPLFEEIIEEAVYSHQSFDVKTSPDHHQSTIVYDDLKCLSAEEKSKDIQIPIKQRLRSKTNAFVQACSEKPVEKKRSKKKSVEIISNEPYTGLPVSIPPKSPPPLSAISNLVILKTIDGKTFISSGNSSCSDTYYVAVPASVPIPLSLNSTTKLYNQDTATTMTYNNVVVTQTTQQNDNDSFDISDYLAINPSTISTSTNIVTDSLAIMGSGMPILTDSLLKDNIPLLNEIKEKKTPPTSNINHILTKSNSTPRRRASHVRVLNFNTPSRNKNQLSVIREQAQTDSKIEMKNNRTITPEQKKTSKITLNSLNTPAKTTDNIDIKCSSIQESPIPQLQGGWDNVAGMDTILFTDEDRIKSVKTGNSNKYNSVINSDDNQTPRVKKDPSSCVKVLSQTVNKKVETMAKKALNPPKPKNLMDVVKNAENTDKKRINVENIDEINKQMEEWKKIRSVSSKNFDQHLREIERQKTMNKTDVEVKKQPVPKSKAKNKKKSKTVKSTNMSDENIDDTGANDSMNMHAKLLEDALKSVKKPPPNEIELNKDESKISIENTEKNLSLKLKKKKKVLATKKRKIALNKSNSIVKMKPNNKSKGTLISKPSNLELQVNNIEIKSNEENKNTEEMLVPKLVEVAAVSTDEKFELQNKINIPIDNQDSIKICSAESENIKDKIKDNDIEIGQDTVSISEDSEKFISPNENNQISKVEVIGNRRNLLDLLETPFKCDLSTLFPITPRLLIPPLQDTPIAKIMKTIQGQVSAIKLPELPTPDYPLTPGINLTPERESPRSFTSRPTDYSSCSSYYKPDESEDLNKKLDLMLNENRRARRESELTSENEEIKNKLTVVNVEVKNQINFNMNIREMDELIVITKAVQDQKQSTPIPENLKTPLKLDCPKVLERVKSFTEQDLSNKDLHYNFVAGENLPDTSDSSDSSNTSDSSSKNSDSDSSSSSSSSTSSSSSSSDSEDGEWQSKETIELDTNQKMIDNNGEVRYPLRNWITPQKNEPIDDKTSPLAKEEEEIKVDFVSNQQKIQLMELEQKRLRILEKIKNEKPNSKAISKPVQIKTLTSGRHKIVQQGKVFSVTTTLSKRKIATPRKCITLANVPPTSTVSGRLRASRLKKDPITLKSVIVNKPNIELEDISSEGEIEIAESIDAIQQHIKKITNKSTSQTHKKTSADKEDENSLNTPRTRSKEKETLTKKADNIKQVISKIIPKCDKKSPEAPQITKRKKDEIVQNIPDKGIQSVYNTIFGDNTDSEVSFQEINKKDTVEKSIKDNKSIKFIDLSLSSEVRQDKSEMTNDTKFQKVQKENIPSDVEVEKIEEGEVVSDKEDYWEYDNCTTSIIDETDIKCIFLSHDEKMIYSKPQKYDSKAMEMNVYLEEEEFKLTLSKPMDLFEMKPIALDHKKSSPFSKKVVTPSETRKIIENAENGKLANQEIIEARKTTEKTKPILNKTKTRSNRSCKTNDGTKTQTTGSTRGKKIPKKSPIKKVSTATCKSKQDRDSKEEHSKGGKTPTNDKSIVHPLNSSTPHVANIPKITIKSKERIGTMKNSTTTLSRIFLEQKTADIKNTIVIPEVGSSNLPKLMKSKIDAVLTHLHGSEKS